MTKGRGGSMRGPALQADPGQRGSKESGGGMRAGEVGGGGRRRWREQ